MIKKITQDSFKPYGKIIEYPNKHLKDKKKNLFRIVVNETQGHGWRIAYLVLRNRTISRLESHPNTFETFEPIKGKALLYAATNKEPKKIDCFRLDRPVVLDKGIWHGVVAVSKEAEIKITENSSVKTKRLLLDEIIIK